MPNLPDAPIGALASLPAGPRTDVQILLQQGAEVTDRSDHLVVRSPDQPRFHWGNFVQVTGGDPADADRWVGAFDAAFPDAAHVAIGLPALPPSAPYARHGLEVSTDDVLATRRLPQQRPLDPAYAARPLAGDDWEQVIAARVADNAASGEHEPADFERFIRDRVAGHRDLVERGRAHFVGAFAGDDLVSELGVVLLGDTARYQNVGTRAAHRRRGLAGHLLGLAARWAQQHGAREWVIVTESTNPAGRLYRSVGFELDVAVVSAYAARRA